MAETVSGSLRLPWVAWIWGDARKAGTSTAALALARWLARVQTAPIRLLEGHLTHPGLGRLLYPGHPDKNPVRPGLGWEAMWTAGLMAQDPPRVVTLMHEQLAVWLMGQPLKIPHPERRWPQVVQRMPDVALLIDGGLMPPPMPVALAVMVLSQSTHRPNVPDAAWVAYRTWPPQGHVQTLHLPTEPLDWEGVGSAAWSDVWAPLAAGLGLMMEEGQGG
ncbi:MAG: hypothetical protein M0Z36_09960 [Thermaerobacter sp.]|nr:hypothetical protein [Thermaerobacter sp.]